MKKTLRPYQVLGKELIYDAFRRGKKRLLYWMQTGGGKSLQFTDIIGDLHNNHVPVVLVMRRRALVAQASAHLDGWGVPHGIHMATHRRYRPQELVQVCSIDTLDARKMYPHSDKSNVVVIVDECHDDNPKASKYVKLHLKYPNAHFIGFTATPFGNNSHYEEIICPISASELRDQGYLVPERTYVPHQINLSGVKIVRGEFEERAAFEAASNSQIVGDFVRDWKMYAQGRRTFIYGINIEHSRIICDSYNAAGIRTVHLDANSPESTRTNALKRLDRHEIDAISSVNLLSTGVDLPSVSCIQLARPTLSLIWHYQAIGRGLRPAPWVNKEDCMIIDNAGNTLRHGPVYYPREVTIGESVKNKDKEKEVLFKRCDNCGFIMATKITTCPQCNAINEKTERYIRMVDGELVEYSMTPEEREMMNKKLVLGDLWKLYNVARMRGYKKDWIYNALRMKYGRPTIEKYDNELKEQEMRWNK